MNLGPPLIFEPIHLDAHASICVAFRRDAYLSSFGEDGFFTEAGPDGAHYLERIRAHMARFPGGYVHAWRGDEIVGQMEMQILEEPRRGYVNLFYLVEEARGTGLGADLQAYAMAWMRRQGVRLAELSVSPTNARALAFYRKHGWEDLGLRPGRDDVHLMQCDVPLVPTLHTDRLVLRPVRLADAPAIQRHFATWDIIRHLTTAVPWPYPDDGAESFLRDACLPQVEQGRRMTWALTLRGGDDACIGLLDYRLGPDVRDHRGFWLAVEHHGQALMTEAVTAFQDHVFLVSGVDRLRVHSAIDNPASRRVKEKTGATHVGTTHIPHHSGEDRADIWEITRARWAGIRRG